MVKLPERWVQYLLTQPETGMGYQIVLITWRTGGKVYTQVMNGDQVTANEGETADDIVELEVCPPGWPGLLD